MADSVAGPSNQNNLSNASDGDDVSFSHSNVVNDQEENDQEKIVKPLTREELEEYQAIQQRAGIIYISRIPPGMSPAKVRHLLSEYGEIGRVYLQQEDPKRAYLRKKFTTTKKPHFTEGWVEFKDKKVARTVAEMLNAQNIGGKKGTRWRDDVWTMKYLPRFKWHMLTEQVAHEAAVHREKLRLEISQSRHEQNDYLRQVEIARSLEKRAAKKRKREEDGGPVDDEPPAKSSFQNRFDNSTPHSSRHKEKVQSAVAPSRSGELDNVLLDVF